MKTIEFTIQITVPDETPDIKLESLSNDLEELIAQKDFNLDDIYWEDLT